VSPEKRVDRTIEIARRTGIPLKIAAKIDPTNQDYYEREIVPLLGDDLVEFVGEIGEAQKNEFLGHACALLFPIDWPEPFGLVMIEAMACGTPVIAYRNGSVPELLEDGRTGFVVNGMQAAIAAVNRIGEISREECRKVFEERFSVRRMARDYLRVYEQVAAQAAARTPRK
jgi:glycosyltransferase involved in cell wall biosynthesis